MSTELLNLLPSERRRALTREYVFRLGTVGIGLLIALVAMHGLLLVPSHLYVVEQLQSRRDQLAVLQAASSASGQESIAARIQSLDQDTAHLAALKDLPTASAAISGVLRHVPRTGITLTGFTFSAKGGGASPELRLSGVAASRDALRRYVEALDALPYIDKANLPISAYAEEKNISFTITLTGSLTP